MYTLILPVFRSKIKLVLTIIIFTFLFIFLTLTYYNYNKNLSTISELKNSLENYEINVLVENEEVLDKVKIISHIENIDINEIDKNMKYLTIQIDNKDNFNLVMNKLEELELNPTKSKKMNEEIETYKSVENIYKVFITVTCISTILILIMEIILEINWNIKNIIFLKILGYSNLIIMFIMLFRIFIPILISMILSLVILFVYLFIISSLNVNIFIFLICISLILLIIQIILLRIKIYKIKVL